MSKEQTYASLLTAVAQNEQKYDKLKSINLVKQKQVRELQIANENKRQIGAKPLPDDEVANEEYNNQIRQIIATPDDMEAQEQEYAKLQLEQGSLE